MIDFLKGTLVEASPLAAVIECNGIGYKVFIPANSYNQLPNEGSEISLYTAFIVRETAFSLYGFLSKKERQLFEAFLAVSGIGPKMSLGLVGNMSADELHAAISQQNVAKICKVPGIGKKTAERLLIETRDKIDALLSGTTKDVALSAEGPSPTGILKDAMSALVNLGYSQGNAQKALEKCLKNNAEPKDLGELITDALQRI